MRPETNKRICSGNNVPDRNSICSHSSHPLRGEQGTGTVGTQTYSSGFGNSEHRQ